MKNFIIAANWKMQRPFKESIQWCNTNKEKLLKLCETPHIKLVLCPSFVALQPLIQQFKNTDIKIGAQNCAQFERGAYTGEVSTESLAQIGCDYCIVGHSERRHFFGETNEMITEKVSHLIAHKITPIICIGETEQEYNNKKTFSILEQQLAPILKKIKKTENTICIAYEPVWAIGTGLVPDTTYLTTVFAWLKNQTTTLNTDSISLLYGGSVNSETGGAIKAIKNINGFLVCSASLDFQKLEKIVLL
jgi:triosephosphate isomerase